MQPFETAPVLPGETLAGKYKVERILGRGGMGIVVAARHLELDERVAIKFLLRKDDPVAVERFLREARAAVKVKSEHVCRVYDVGRLETGEPYLVMEYLDGVDLAERLGGSGRIGVALVARWMIEVCAALGEAHAIGIVHRDLKPANIFLAKRSDGTEHVKVLDFGISKLPSTENMTSTSATMGTPIYMSPEQVASARDVDHRTDVWSLGVIMHELVSGKPPFAGDSLIQLSVKIREADAPSLSSVADDLPAGFEAIVTKCLAKAPADRWASVGELASALAPFADADSARLADRTARTLTSAKIALAETIPHTNEKPVRELAPEQLTLEPLSRASVDERAAPRTRWQKPVMAFALAGIVILLGARMLERKDQAMPPAANDAAPVASLAASTPATAIVEPPPSAMPTAFEAPPPPSSAAKPRIVAPVRPAVVDAGAPVVTEPNATTVAPSAAPSADPPAEPGRKRRPIDRTDPFAH